jgi:MFS family permease
VSRRPTATRLPFFYGWMVVGATFTMLMTASGLGFYALTLYLRRLTDERGFSVSSVSGATALFFVVSGLTGVVVGRLINRGDPRPVVASGAVLAALAIAALGRVEELWQVYAAYAVFGAGFSACALVPSSTLVSRWFHRRRSVALSISSTGLSFGGIVLTPAAAALIDRIGFSDATLWLALVFLVGVIPITALLLKADPADLGLRPDGDPVPPDEVVRPALAGVPFDEAVHGRLFRFITAAWTLGLLAQVGGIAHLYSLVGGRIDNATAATAVSVLAACSMGGRLLGGWLLNRVPLRAASLAWLVLQAVGLVSLGLFEGRIVLLLASAVFGLSVGNVLLLQPIVLAEVFGVRDYPRILARSQLVSTVGVASGPLAIGVLRDATGGYAAAYLAATIVSLAASAVLVVGGPLREFEPDPAVPDLPAVGGATALGSGGGRR